MSVDPKVYDLAALFLSDHFQPDHARTLALAEAIQFTIETWIVDEAPSSENPQ